MRSSHRRVLRQTCLQYIRLLSRYRWTWLLLLSVLGAALVFASRPGAAKAEAGIAIVKDGTASQSSTSARGKINGKIVFSSDRNKGKGFKLWTMNPDGSNPTLLTDDSTRSPNIPSYVNIYDERAKWSPDGTEVAFRSNRNIAMDQPGGDDYTIYIVNADGSNLRRFVVWDLPKVTNYPHIGSFEWSPDASGFVLVAGNGNILSDEPITYFSNLFIASADGTYFSQVTNDGNILNSNPTWSPDGKQIALTRSDQMGHSEIDVVDVNSLARRTLVASGNSPVWSPDGSRIFFVGSGNLYAINSDGTNLTQLTHSNSVYGPVRWSPDRSKILFEQQVSQLGLYFSQAYALFVMNADGTGAVNITNRYDNGFGDVEPDWQPLSTPSNDPPASVLGFASVIYVVPLTPSTAQITVNRTDNINQAVSCDYQTAAGNVGGSGFPHGTLNFAPGETSKTIELSIGPGTYVVGLFNNQGNATFVGGNNQTVVIGLSSGSNPLDDNYFFVLQQYRDFLSREPDEGGFNYWIGQINQCLNQTCARSQRINVSDAFFFEPEFQDTGAFVYRVYKASFGSNPTFAQFSTDRAQVVGGSDLNVSKTAFALSFVGRRAFVQMYPRSQTSDQFVDALLQTVRANSNIDLSSQRSALTALYDGTDAGRAAIIRQIADYYTFIDAEYNRAFVLTEYFGYLRRDPDQAGYEFWLGQVNSRPLRDTNIQHAMVCSFITSAEYQQRFSSVVTHSNAECPQ